MNKNRVFINSYTCSTCVGDSAKELFENILKQKTGIKRDELYIKKPVAIGFLSSKYDYETLIIRKLQELLKNSNLNNFSDSMLVVGSSVGGMYLSEKEFFKKKSFENIDFEENSINYIASFINQKFNFKDYISFSTACTSSANALGYAYELISYGVYQSVVVVGVDFLTKTTVRGFNSLELVSQNPCKPFDIARDGMNVAEGVAVLLLENKKKKNSVEICSVGYSSDAYHMTKPHSEGSGFLKAMSEAVKNANIDFDDIDYINAHGTSTLANDLSEAKAIKNLFKTSFVSSTKSITGHTLGAAGAIEAIICIEAIKNNLIPPNTNLIKPEIDDINFPTKKINQKIYYALSNSFAFGGNNVSIIFGRVED